MPTLLLNTLSLHSPFARDDWDAVLDQVPEGANAGWREATEEFRARRNDAEPDTTFAEWSIDLVGRMQSLAEHEFREALVCIGSRTLQLLLG